MKCRGGASTGVSAYELRPCGPLAGGDGMIIGARDTCSAEEQKIFGFSEWEAEAEDQVVGEEACCVGR